MADMSWSELASDLGENTADGLRNAANTAGNFVCGLYANYPGNAVPGLDPTGIGAFSKGLWDKLCGPRSMPPPLPSSPPFSGGQCPKLYNLTATVQGGSDSGPFPPDTRSFTDVQGPISGFQMRRDNPSDPDTISVYLVTAGGELTWGVQGLRGYVPTATMDALVPSDGSSDDCGSPPISYPDVDAPPDNWGDDKPWNVGGPSITVPVAIIPVLIENEFNFRPQINVRVGPIQVTFDLGGVTFNLYNQPTSNPVLPPGRDTRPVPPSPSPPKIGPGCDITPVIRKLVSLDQKYSPLLDCDRCDESFSYPITIYDEAESRKVTGIAPRLYSVSVDITSYPVNSRSQPGGLADDVLYLGWFSFMFGSSHGERLPLNYQHQTFVAPESATGFSYTCYKGVLATSRSVRKVRA